MEQKNPSSQRQLVYWLSRHWLSTEQCRILRHLHGQDVEVIHYNLRTSFEDFLEGLKDCSAEANMIYVVAPRVFVWRASEHGFCLRKFGSFDFTNTDSYRVRCVYEYNNGQRSIVLSYADLRRLGLVEVRQPCLIT